MGIMSNSSSALAEHADLRKKVIEAAISIVEAEGYENLSIKKIGTRLGLSVATIHIFYRNKHQIIRDLTEDLYYKIMLAGTTLAKNPRLRTAEQKLREVMTMMIQSFTRDSEMTRTIMHSGVREMFTTRHGHCMPSNMGLELINEILEQGIRDHEFRPWAAGSAWMLLSSLLGFIMSCVENGICLSEHFDLIIANYVELFLGGLRS